MVITTFLLLTILPALLCIGLQALAMRQLAPIFGVGRPEFIEAAGVSTRIMLLVIFLLILLNFMPFWLCLPLAIAFALGITAFQSHRDSGVEITNALMYIITTTMAAAIGLAIVAGFIVLCAKMGDNFLTFLDEKYGMAKELLP